MLAINLSDRTILFTDQLTDDSQVLLNRAIRDRVTSIAPFLVFDGDPYLTIVDGRLIWIIDAYTATDRFPNSTPMSGVNYIRHTIKATVDAYDGTVTFYRTVTPDPIADAYGGSSQACSDPSAKLPRHWRSIFAIPKSCMTCKRKFSLPTT